MEQRMREKEEEVSTLLYKVSNKLLAIEQLQKSKQDLEYCQRRIREVEKENRVLKGRPLLVQAGTQTDQILTPPCSMSSIKHCAHCIWSLTHTCRAK